MVKKALITAALLCLGVGLISPVYADDHGGRRGGHDGGHHRGHDGGRNWNHGEHRGNWGHGGHGWDRGGPRFGFYFGDPFAWGPRYFDRPYYAPSYYTPPAVIIEREPPVYVQRSAPPPAQVAQLWYYCPNPAGYYPTIPNCSQAWVPVDPRSVPPAPPR